MSSHDAWSQAVPSLQLKPLISYPREAQVGKTYLVSIDVQLATPETSWDFPEEEYTIGFIFNAQPYFTCKPLHETWPTVVLHRYGGTYGPAEYLFTAADQEIGPGHITITLVNGSGIPMTKLELPCQVKQESEVQRERREIMVSPPQEPALVEARDKKSLVEQEARARVDRLAAMLTQAGWTIVDHYNLIPPPSATGLALKGHADDKGIDFLLVVNGEAVGVVAEEGRYTWPGPGPREPKAPIFYSPLIIESGRAWLSFVYEMQGEEIHFLNHLEPEERSRIVFHFHRPETFALWLQQAPASLPYPAYGLLRSQLRDLPDMYPLQREGLYEHQFEAISNLEHSLAQNRSHALIEMAEDTGQTYTALNSIYRLLRYGGAKRILYVFDSPLKVNYALNILGNFVPASSRTRLMDLYNVHYMMAYMPLEPDMSIYVTTLEQLYATFNRLLSGSDASSEKVQSAAQVSPEIRYNPMIPIEYQVSPEMRYNPMMPIEYFDVIILGDCDSTMYQQWRPLIEYFDAFIVGIGNEVDDKLRAMFANNVVYEQDTQLPRVLLCTSLPVTYEVARTYLTKPEEVKSATGVYEQGIFFTDEQSWMVRIMVVRMGNAEAIERAIRDFQPDVVCFVGVAVGLKDVRLGDVVVATSVYNYKSGRVSGTFQVQHEIILSPSPILQRAAAEARKDDWLKRLPELPTRRPKVFCGPIVEETTFTSSRSASMRSFIEDNLEDVLAIDRENYDALRSSQVGQTGELLIVRGIADVIDGNGSRQEADGTRRVAVQHACAFAFELLARLNPTGLLHSDDVKVYPGLVAVSYDEFEAFLRDQEHKYWLVDKESIEEFITGWPASVDELMHAIAMNGDGDSRIYVFRGDASPEEIINATNWNAIPEIEKEEMDDYVVRSVSKGKDFLWFDCNLTEARNGEPAVLLPYGDAEPPRYPDVEPPRYPDVE